MSVLNDLLLYSYVCVCVCVCVCMFVWVLQLQLLGEKAFCSPIFSEIHLSTVIRVRLKIIHTY